MVNGEAPKRRFRLRTLAFHMLKVAVGVAVVAFLLHKYDIREVYRVIRSADLRWLGAAWVVGLLAMVTFVYMQAIGYQRLGSSISPLFLLKVQFQQRFFAMFLPGGGEVVVKWYKLAKPSGKPGMTAALMVFLRVLSSTGITLMIALTVLCDSTFPWPSVQWLAPWVILFSALPPLVLILPTGRRALSRLRLAVRVPARFQGAAEKLAEVPRVIGQFSIRELVAILVLSVVSQVLFIIQQALCGYAVGINLHVVTFGWLRAPVAACAGLPVTISGLGLREASMVVCLSYYDIPEAQAIGYSLLFFAAIPFAKGVVGGILELVDLLRSFRRSAATR